MIYLRMNLVLGVLLFVFVIALAPIPSISAQGNCCYIADPRLGYDACVYDPNYGEYEQECCNDSFNKCWGDVSIISMDYTWVYMIPCATLKAPCPETDPELYDAIYQNQSGNAISRRGFMCVRQPDPWDCTTEPPIGCGPKTTWANYEYQTCTEAECDDKYCD